MHLKGFNVSEATVGRILSQLADQAERAMIQHIESLILDVKRYWSIAKI
ncbi:hypothetical protein DSBG_3546 [Desulfosporosinus sp. BG]|nr:hypothetical protein DSBG_3546 [Desulfosporosinus sp. BG]